MNHDFCVGCDSDSGLYLCTIGLVPDNAYIETLINNEPLTMQEIFICHKTAQNLSEGKLSIHTECDDCGLCQITCPNISIDYTTFFSPKLEKVIFSDLGKASILFQRIFPDTTVATEVQVKGNFRTKRIDLIIKKDIDVYLIKLIKTTDKIPFYMRSYKEVINYYHTIFPGIAFHALCLVPNAKLGDIVHGDADIKDLFALNTLIGEI